MNWSILALVLFAIAWHEGDGQAKKQVMTLNERVQQLNELTAKKALFRFSNKRFRDLVKRAPRNYSVVVMFTAMSPQRRCGVCSVAFDEFKILANSFRMSQGYSNKLYFGLVDFDEEPDVFQLMRLNTAPVIMHFPDKGEPKPGDTMDISRLGYFAETMAKWIQDRTDIHIRVFRPPNYAGAIAFCILSSLVASLLYVRRNNLEFLYNRTMWAVGSLCFCFIMMSGQMWNHIRGPPFVHKNQNGQIGYMHGSSQAQFIAETYIVMIFYAAISFGVILLTESGKAKKDVQSRSIMAILGLVLLTVFFSLLLSVFRFKVQGYPYSFLFK